MNIDFGRQREEFERTLLEFVETELKMALTFCMVSKDARNPEKRARNLQNAKLAYQSALETLNRLNEPDAATIVQHLLRDVERELSDVR